MTETRPDSLLIRAPNWVGDAVMLTAILPQVRALTRAAGTRIGILGRPFLKPILAPHADVWLMGDARGGKLPFLTAARAIRASGPWTHTVILPNSWRSALECAWGGAKHRVGYGRDGRGLLLAVSVPRKERGRPFQPVYMAESYARLFRAAGIGLEGLNASGQRPVLVVTPDEQARFDAWAVGAGIAAGMRVLGVNPGASFGSSKCWPPDRFASVMNTLLGSEEYDRALLLSGPGEGEIVRAILDLLTPDSRAKTVAPLEPPLGLDLLKPAVARCAVFLTNDTGPRHFAVAADVPCVTVMGPTWPAYTSTPVERGQVLRIDVPCGPCHKPKCPLPAGPGHHACMTGISAEAAVEAVRRLAPSDGNALA